MPCGEQDRAQGVEGRSQIVTASVGFSFAGMQRHPHPERLGRGPLLGEEGTLPRESRG